MKANKRKDVKSGRGGSSIATVSFFDESLWGTLQNHIELAENIYSKLPVEEFFRLRTVCKDWYNIACRRLALKEEIHKPFFTLFTKGIPGRLDGILVYNASSQSWVWRTSWTHDSSCHFVAVEGVVYCSGDPYVVGAERKSVCAFYWQSKIYHKLHPPPVAQDKTILGMSLTENSRSFCSFRAVRGSQGFDTHVYESGVWQTKPCRVPRPERGGDLHASTGCVDCNGRVYITTEHSRNIFVYDFANANWSYLQSPSSWVSPHCCLDTLGTWNGHVFDATEDAPYTGLAIACSLSVWELVDESLHKWKEYNRMPKDLYLWLRSRRGFGPVQAGDVVSIHARFSGDFMLVYSWDFINGSAGRFCLFNMATKNWQKLEIPAGTVAIRDESSSSDDEIDLRTARIVRRPWRY